MADNYKILYEGGEAEIEVKKSRFIATTRPVKTEEEAIAFIAEMKKKYWDARHNCSAFTIGKNHELTRCSDDGEPSKTAGFPMLDVLKKNDLTNILAITTRYFGGIKLGAGGLIRAYSSSVSAALKDAIFYETHLQSIYQFQIDYSDYSKNIDYWNTLSITSSSFEANVILNIAFFEKDIEVNLEKIKNLTQGKALIKFMENRFIDVAIN